MSYDFFLGSVRKRRQEELAVQAIKEREEAELKAARKAAEDAGKKITEV